MVGVMREGERGRGDAALGVAPHPSVIDRGAAAAVGRRTLVEEAPAGTPVVQAKLGDGGGASTAPSHMDAYVVGSGAAAESREASSISIFDVFGPPVQRKSAAFADAANVADVADRGV